MHQMEYNFYDNSVLIESDRGNRPLDVRQPLRDSVIAEGAKSCRIFWKMRFIHAHRVSFID